MEWNKGYMALHRAGDVGGVDVNCRLVLADHHMGMYTGIHAYALLELTTSALRNDLISIDMP